MGVLVVKATVCITVEDAGLPPQIAVTGKAPVPLTVESAVNACQRVVFWLLPLERLRNARRGAAKTTRELPATKCQGVLRIRLLLLLLKAVHALRLLLRRRLLRLRAVRTLPWRRKRTSAKAEHAASPLQRVRLLHPRCRRARTLGVRCCGAVHLRWGSLQPRIRSLHRHLPLRCVVRLRGKLCAWRAGLPAAVRTKIIARYNRRNWESWHW